MKYIEMQNNLRILGVFTLNDVRTIDPGFREPTLNDWLSNGWIKRIRRFWYADSSFDTSGDANFFIANKVYAPSYVSLESALSFYGFIPESVLQITSITTRKTSLFDTQFGVFRYRSVKSSLFWGYEAVRNNERPFLIASPEKGVLDYLYLHSEITGIQDFEELRFNKELILSKINLNRMKGYLKQFDNLELGSRYRILLQYLHA